MWVFSNEKGSRNRMSPVEEIMDDSVWNKMGRDRTIKSRIVDKTIKVTNYWTRHVSIEKSVELCRQNPGTDKRGFDILYYVSMTDVGLSPRSDTFIFNSEEKARKCFDSLSNFKKAQVKDLTYNNV